MKAIMFAVALSSSVATVNAGSLGPVQPTDTLWKLATEARPDEQVAMVQVVYALWQANPQAFALNNVNSLLAGSVLQVPSRQQMLQTPVQDARRWYYEAISIAPGKTAKRPAQLSKRPAQQPPLAHQPQPVAAQHQPVRSHPVAVQPAPAADKPAPGTATAAPITNSQPSNESWWQQVSRDYTLSAQQRYYGQTTPYTSSAQWHSRASFSAEWAWQSSDRSHQWAFEPFFRWDQRDSEADLFDLRQAYWQYVGDGFDLKAGVDIVFWGVNESQHLVDVINQTDLIAGVDGEAKLGQPMLNWNLYGDAGTLALYILPYFRERTLAGPKGRLGPPLPLLNRDDAFYESAQQERNLDFALRWSQQFGALDIALSYFEGNNREPLLLPAADNGLYLLYLQMQQLGLEAQWIQGSWIWKLESIYRKTRQQDFAAATFGFEYTQVGLWDTDWDLGYLAEYQYDSRDLAAPVPAQNDLFIGARFVVNDAAGSELLLGLVQDLDNSDSRTARLEASMRLSNNLRLRLDAWWFQSNTMTDPLYFIRYDDYLQLSLDYYF